MGALVLRGSLTGKLMTYMTLSFGIAYLIDLVAYYIMKFNVLLFQISAAIRMYTPFVTVVATALIHTPSARVTLRAYGLRFRYLKVKHIITAMFISITRTTLVCSHSFFCVRYGPTYCALSGTGAVA